MGSVPALLGNDLTRLFKSRGGCSRSCMETASQGLIGTGLCFLSCFGNDFTQWDGCVFDRVCKWPPKAFQVLGVQLPVLLQSVSTARIFLFPILDAKWLHKASWEQEGFCVVSCLQAQADALACDDWKRPPKASQELCGVQFLVLLENCLQGLSGARGILFPILHGSEFT